MSLSLSPLPLALFAVACGGDERSGASVWAPSSSTAIAEGFLRACAVGRAGWQLCWERKHRCAGLRGELVATCASNIPCMVARSKSTNGVLMPPRQAVRVKRFSVAFNGATPFQQLFGQSARRCGAHYAIRKVPRRRWRRTSCSFLNEWRSVVPGTVWRVLEAQGGLVRPRSQ